jgi:hypothetical protein
MMKIYTFQIVEQIHTSNMFLGCIFLIIVIPVPIKINPGPTMKVNQTIAYSLLAIQERYRRKGTLEKHLAAAVTKICQSTEGNYTGIYAAGKTH